MTPRASRAVLPVLASGLLLLASTTAWSHQGPTLQTSRATGPISIDGRLDEDAWAAAAVADQFFQRDPNEGEPATERTEVRVGFSDETLYVGVVCYDREPEKII